MTNQPGTEFFHSMRKSLPIRVTDRWIGGVCSGWANRWGVDPLIVRGAVVVLTVVAGFGIVLYALGWLLMPEPDGRVHLQEALAGRFDAAQLGAGGMLMVGLINPGIWYVRGPGGWFFSWVIAAGLIFLAVVAIRHNAPANPPPAESTWTMNSAPFTPPTPNDPVHSSPTASDPMSEPAATEPLFTEPPLSATPPPYEPVATAQAPATAPTITPSDPRATRIFLAISLLVIAGAVALRSTSWAPFNASAVNIELLTIGALLVVLGLGVLTAAFRRRSSGSLGVLGTLMVIFVAIPGIGISQVSPTISSWAWTSGSSYGSADWVPHSSQEAQDGFTGIVIGDVTAVFSPDSLADVADPIVISLAIGNIDLVLPADVPVTVKASTGAGSIDVNYPRNSGYSNQTRDGIGVNFTASSPAALQDTTVEPIVIEASNGLGEVTITFED